MEMYLHILAHVLIISMLSYKPFGYELKCPDIPHRTHRIRIICQGISSKFKHYSCLLNQFNNTYEESCLEAPDFVRPGEKYVISGYRKNINCTASRYQPFKLWSHSQSQCAFVKTPCTEIGQTVYTNGSTMHDRACRCDNSEEYAFLQTQINTCYCIPDRDDCTCFKKSCSVSHSLTSEYKCQNSSLVTSSCFEIVRLSEEESKISGSKEFIGDRQLNSNERSSIRQADINVLTAIVSVLIAIILFMTVLIICSSSIDSCSVRGQLLFATHDEVINKDLFSKEQLYPTENEIEKTITREDRTLLLNTDNQIPDVKMFIDELGLAEYYLDKLQVRHVMKVDISVKSVNLKEIALRFARDILMINFKGRDTYVQENLRKKHKFEADRTNLSEHNLENISKIKNRVKSSEINPLDLTIAVFKCASPMLKHTLASKLFTCQLAVPFVFPKYCDADISLSLIILRSIVIECTSKGKSINEASSDCPCHVVSFVRFGSLSFSKSKLVNEILNDQYHNTFFNRDCPLGSSERCVSEGMIEAAWYLPSRRTSILSCVTTFLNLRGDANSFQEQLRILSNISSVLVILIDVSSLNKTFAQICIKSLLENVHGIILVIDDKRITEDDVCKIVESYLERFKQFRERITFCILKTNGEMRSRSDIKQEMRASISRMIEPMPLSSITSRMEPYKLKTDEDNECYQNVQKSVKNLWKLFPESCSNAKQQVVSVQRKHWGKWKQIRAFRNSSIHKSQLTAEEIKNEISNACMKQVELCPKIHPFMKTFINCMWKFSKDENESHIYVILVKCLLDKRLRKVLPTLQSQYLFDCQSLRAAKEIHKEKAAVEEIMHVVDESEKNLLEAFFGFEHLCRELGQIFEALSECETDNKDIQEYLKILPIIAAKLILIGYPFELVDGDVTHVPHIWINAVFETLKQLIGNKKILSLSVLGIQSSGKSTLLNTMFGSQFDVNTGRFTKGVYALLVPVESGAFPFDYILVIDTEGLRALQQADLKKSHDNELATFVVGLGDITIVTTEGENTTEVQDIMQIVVHAFLRLKLANKKFNLKQRCIFAHQNVPAQDTNEKMEHRRQKFIEILDMMTKEAAAQERIADIQTFNQVIDLDIEKDIWYFSDLWRGDPPMAPANPGYSETVADALKSITQRLIVQRETYLTITSIITRIENLWLGILKDDFVFNFRNCLEFKAYNDMERHFHSLTWRLEQKVQEFIKTYAKSILMTCDHPDDLDARITTISLQLSRLVINEINEGKNELNSFIDSNCLKDVMIQWQQNKYHKLQSFGDELIIQAKIDIFNMKEELKIQKKHLTDKTKHEIEINRLAEQIAAKMKGSFPNENIIQQEFNKMWNGWISEFDTKAINHRSSIKEQIELLIHNRFPSDVAYSTEDDKSPILSDNQYLSMKQLEQHFSIKHIKDEHLSIRSTYYSLNGNISKIQTKCKTQMIEIVTVIFRKIDYRLSALKVQDTKFNISYVSGILEVLCNAFDDHNTNTNNGYNFNLTTAFRSCICSHVKRYLVIFFERLDEKFNRKHSPKAVMEKYKDTVWKLFTTTVETKLKI